MPPAVRAAVLAELSDDERAVVYAAYAPHADGLLDFVAATTPRFVPPRHLAPVAALLERARRGVRVRALISAPPRHGKTELLLHTIPWWLRARPHDTVGYISYGAQFAHGKSRMARGYAAAAGFEARPDFDTVAECRNAEGGGWLATGIDGPLTGKGLNLLLLDDPHKDRVEAESLLARNRVEEWTRGTALTRLEPDASALIFQQRWTDDDIYGRLARDGGWEVINLPALDADGTPLWPERWSREALEALRVEIGEYNWWSQYMGEPRPRGGRVFGDPVRYVEPDKAGARIVLAVDGAGTESDRSDYSAALALAMKGDGATQSADVLEVWRDRLEPPVVAARLAEFQARHAAGNAMVIEASRDGKAIAKALRGINPALHIVEWPPIGDKFTRAQPVAAAWNTSRVRVPLHAPWVADFLAEVGKFTGVGDRHDDQIDALSMAWNFGTRGGAPGKVLSVGTARSHAWG